MNSEEDAVLCIPGITKPLSQMGLVEEIVMNSLVCTSQEEAQVMIDAVCVWLKTLDPGSLPDARMEPACANNARDFAGDLLEAGRAYGMGGCPLCQH